MSSLAVTRRLGQDDPSMDAPGRSVRVLIVADEALTHWGFRLLLSNQPWVERCLPAEDAPTALSLALRFEPHIAVVDVGLIGVVPDAFCQELQRQCERTSILLLTSADAMSPSTLCMCGAAGYVSRTWRAGDLVRTIRGASLGLPSVATRPTPQSPLSARQQEILQLIASGETNAEIARRLYLSRHTVKQHTSALYRKLDARNRMHAVQAAQRLGIIAS